MAQFSVYPKIPNSTTLGQQVMANSLPVVIASDQTSVHTTVDSSALPAGASTSAKQDTGNTSLASIDSKVPSNLTVTSTRLLVDGSGVTQPVSGTFWQATQPVSAASLPLPTGAATSAKQPALGTAGTASTDVITIQGIASMTALKVDGSAVTQPVSAVSLPLPTGAATEATLSAQSAKLPATLGQHAMAASLSVALSSDQSAIPVTQSGTWSTRSQDGSGNALTSFLQGSNRGLNVSPLGKTAVAKARNDYSGTNVTTSAYVQLIATVGATDVQEVEIFDSSGQTLLLATGGAGSEVDQVYILPGGNGRIPLRIASGTRVAVKAVSATANVGELTVNFYG
jgi:hypothetical protein